MRTLVTLGFGLCLLATTSAQKQVRIVDPAILDIAPDVRHTPGVETCLAATGSLPEQVDLVLRYGDRSYWPAGIREDSLRAENRIHVQDYIVYRVCDYPLEGKDMAVLMVPATENAHMPEALRPLVDFYMVLPEASIRNELNGKNRPTISRGPRWKGLPEARIQKPDDIYANYDLSDDSVALQAFTYAGMSDAEIASVVFRSTEYNWPTGINTFDKRFPRLQDFKKYKAYVGAEWGDKVLLIVPYDRNSSMATVMRPYVDLYFVYARSAVEVRKVRKKR